jgi:23S rRNA G2445 N2-methylase RlmL
MELITKHELQAAGGTVTQILRRFDERTSLLFFTYRKDPASLLRLGTTEDVFVVAAELDSVPGGRPALAKVRAAVSSSRTIEEAVAVALRARPHRRFRITYRVVARKAGEHAFRRVDLQRAVELGVADRFPGWRLVEDGGQLEVWAQLVGARLVVVIRLSDNTMRQRSYRVESLPAALKPTVARGLVLLSEPRPDDVFLDPMCGSGTILIERALAARYRLLLGGDSDADAVRAARANIGPRHKPVQIRRWDARALPLEDHSVSAIVTNLPFGKQIGTAAENRTLYPELMTEWVRVLEPAGRMVLLTSERDLMRRTLQPHENLRVTRQLRVLVRGQEATVYVIRYLQETRYNR